MENTNNTTQLDTTEDRPVEINLKTLLQVGGHFGTKTSLWNPKCAPFIYGVRNGVYIIDLENTVKYWKQAKDVIVSTVAAGGTVLFVGTKKQASEAVLKHAQRCGAFYVNHKWSAGTLTNFKVLRKSVDKMESIEAILKDSTESGKSIYTKKELVMFQRSVDKMLRSLGGIRGMKKLPTLIFITDANRENLAVAEANKSRIPVMSLADTDCNPSNLTYPIPANDDAVRALDLFCAAVADAVLEGKELQKVSNLIEEKLNPEVEEREVTEFIEKQNQNPKESQEVRRSKPRNTKRDKNLRVEVKRQ